MPLPNEICKIIKNYNYGTYIETGLASGEGVEQALNLNFKKIISIEIDKKSIEDAKIKFADYIKIKKLELLEGDSGQLLDLALKNNKDTTVIFLDAHGGEHDDNAPLENELKVIEKYFNNQKIIIDDCLKIKYNYIFDNKKYWVKKNNYNIIYNKLKGTSQVIDEFVYGKIGKYNSLLVNFKIDKSKLNLKKIEIKIYYFFYPIFVFFKKIIKEILKLFIGNHNYLSLRKKSKSIISKLVK